MIFLDRSGLRCVVASRSGRSGAKGDAGTSPKCRDVAGGRRDATLRAGVFRAAVSSKGLRVLPDTRLRLLLPATQNTSGAGAFIQEDHAPPGLRGCESGLGQWTESLRYARRSR